MGKRHQKPCVICGTPFFAPPSSRNVTCSTPCSKVRMTQVRTGKTQSWNEESRARLALRGQTTNLQAGTKAALTSPLAGRGQGNIHAKAWCLRSPQGVRYEIINLQAFVRANAHLFAPADVTWKRTGGRRGTGGEYCNATAGIQAVRAGRCATWKEWSLAQTSAAR